MLRFLALLSIFQIITANCPKKFELVRNGECYRQIDPHRKIYSSQAIYDTIDDCKDYKSHPVIIHSQEDNDFWVSVAQRDSNDKEDYGNVLLGLECNTDKKKWRWADKSKLTWLPEGMEDLADVECTTDCAYYIDPDSGDWIHSCNSKIYIDEYCVAPLSKTPVPVDDDCAEFSLDDDDDVCYQVGTTKTNWTEAQSICRSFGANLASVHTKQENSFIRRLAVSKGLVNGLHLGGKWKDGIFTWIDSTPWDYTNFAASYPRDGYGTCLGMDTNNTDGLWHNIECWDEINFACVRKTSDTERQCDGGVRQEGEIIYSPGFPGSASEPCDFILQVPEGKRIEVEILVLEANSCCDKLVIAVGTLGGKVIAELTGVVESGTTYKTKSSNYMRVSWQPKDGRNVRGAMFTFRSLG